MSKSEEAENLYQLLPRFVMEADNEIKNRDEKYLPAISRNFTWNELEFEFVISPDRVPDDDGTDRHYYPQKREQIIETALRRMVKKSEAFSFEKLSLEFSALQLMNEVQSLNPDLSLDDDDLDLGLKILADVKYELLRGGSELYFRPIEKFLTARENDCTFYFAQFSEIFFRRTRRFDFCFGVAQPGDPGS